MRIVQLTAENLKRIRAVSIAPQGHVVQLTGRNGQGKSSVLDAIWMALEWSGKSAETPRPIRDGESKATIRLDLGDIVCERKFTAKTNTLVVSRKDGTRFTSPQAVLDELLGRLTFDPLAFTREKPAEQLKTLRGVVDCPFDFDGAAEADASDYQRRTEVNRDAKAMAARVASLEAEVPNALPPMEDVTELVDKLAGLAESNAKIEEQRTRRRNLGQSIIDARGLVERTQQEILELEERLAGAEDRKKRLETALAEFPEIPEPENTDDIRKRIDRANEAKVWHDKAAKLDEERAALVAKQREAEAFTERMAARAKEREAAMRATKMPVEGLAFGDGEVLLHGVPLSQASSAEQLKVSLGLAMAANPKLRVVLIRDGSLLDAESMATVAAMAEAHDFQVWIERVEDAGAVGFVIEDGQLAEVPQEVANG